MTEKDETHFVGIRISGDKHLSGFRFGFSQPCVISKVDVHGPYRMTTAHMDTYGSVLSTVLPAGRFNLPKAPLTNPSRDAIACIAHAANALQDSMGIPNRNDTYSSRLQTSTDTQENWLLALPAPAPKAARLALQEAVSLFNACKEGSANVEYDALERVLDQLAEDAGQGVNTPRLIRKALARGIPMLRLPGGTLQFGWGRRGRLFNSSFSEKTSAIGTNIAKNKLQTNAMLRMAGFPVPEQVIVTDLDQAHAEADRIGYPVVVKPADLDGGQGVEAGLQNAKQLTPAFARVTTHKRPILLEKHVDGVDVRITIIDGTYFSSAWRYPASVTGDGTNTIRHLVDAVNADPRRSKRRFSQMKPIELDEEAHELLETLGLTPQSVPDKGRVVRLRRTANMSSGGHTRIITDELHPDNIRLGENVARLFRLDIAGIDLIIEDPTRSWKEVGSAICEVNAQPQMGFTLTETYDRVFDTSLDGDGRIPSCLVLTDTPDYATTLAKTLQGSAPEMHLDPVMSVSTVSVQTTPKTPCNINAVLMNSHASAVVMIEDGTRILRDGLALDRVDEVWVGEWSGAVNDLQRTLSAVLPHIRETLVLLDMGKAKSRFSIGTQENIQVRRMDIAAAIDALKTKVHAEFPINAGRPSI